MSMIDPEQIPSLDINRALFIIRELEQADLRSVEINDLTAKLMPALRGYITHGRTFPTGYKLYRATVWKQQRSSFIKQLSYPPAESVKLGRVNREKEAVFYAANLREISFFEAVKARGVFATLSEWELTSELNVSLVGYDPEVFQKQQSNRECPNLHSYDLTNLQQKESKEITHHLARIFSQKVDTGDEYKYKLSIAISEVLRRGDMIQGIMYPTIAMQANGDNLTINTNFADAYLKLCRAEFLKINQMKDFKYKITSLDIATRFRKDGKILWERRPGVYKKDGQ